MNFAFISRHIPTDTQVQLAADAGVNLVHVGDADAFTVTPAFVHGRERDACDSGFWFDGVVVVHPAAALRLANNFLVGVFENANRAPEGAPVSFEAVSFHVFDLRG